LRYQEGVRKSDYRITSPFRRLFAHVWGEESLRTESVGRTGSVAGCWPPVCPGGTSQGEAEVPILWFHIWEGTETGNAKSGADCGKEAGWRSQEFPPRAMAGEAGGALHGTQGHRGALSTSASGFSVPARRDSRSLYL